MENEGNPNAPNTPDDTGAGGGSGNWYDSLPEDLRGNEALKGFDGVESLAKAHLTAQDELEGLKKQIEDGRPVIPDKPEGYELPAKFDGAPDEMAVEISKQLSQIALAAGLSKEQAGKAFEAVMASELQSLKDEAAAIERHQAEVKAGLQKQYGDKYAETMNTAFLRCSEIAAKVGVDKDAFKAFLDSSAVGDDPTFIAFAVGLSKVISPDSFEHNAGPGAERSAAAVLYPNMAQK